MVIWKVTPCRLGIVNGVSWNLGDFLARVKQRYKSLQMKVIRSIEMSVNTYQSTGLDVEGDLICSLTRYLRKEPRDAVSTKSRLGSAAALLLGLRV